VVKTAQTRLRGRPQAGSGERENAFRELLVDAARDLFADQGFAATSLRQISLRAGVTPALAHYYFKDKAGLLVVLMRERVAPLTVAIAATLEEHETDAVAALAAFVQQFTRVSSRNPWLPALLLRELVDDADPMTQAMRPLVQKLQALVAAGQERNLIRRDLHAQSIVQSVLSLCAFPFLAGDALRKELGASADASAAIGMTLHHLAVLQDGLRPRATKPAQRQAQSPRQDPSS
jgi:TetR/AcrR family transcriptional regulator